MSSLSDFTPVFDLTQSHKKSANKGKRKRGFDPDDSEQEDVTASESFDSEGVDVFRKASKSADSKKSPFYVAGWHPDRSLPEAPYPHGPQSLSHSRSKSESKNVSRSRDQYRSLQQQHLAVMSSILHVSLLRGDYIRAGRAFGMLLRSRFNNDSLDVRKNGLWGIGAEILLRRDASDAADPMFAARRNSSDEDSSSTSTDQDSIEPPKNASSSEPITKEGFRAAKDFYEQLILQYPPYKQMARSASAMTFHPALFSVMIYEASEASRRRLQDIENASSDQSDQSLGSIGSPAERSLATDKAEIKRQELSAANDIAQRVDDLLLSPPYDRHVPLLQLRGMLCLWIADLNEDLSSKVTTDGEDDSDRSADGLDQYYGRQERERNAERAAPERNRAKNFFRAVVDSGGSLPDQVQHLVS